MGDADWPDIFPLEGAPPLGFKCGRVEQDEFLHHRAWPEQQAALSVTYLAHLHGVNVGFMTIAMDAIVLQTREKPDGGSKVVRFPAVKLAQLGVDQRWKRRGVGTQMVALAAGIALKLGSRVGCRYLTVDSKSDMVEWYRAQEFRVNKEARKSRAARAAERGVEPEVLPLSMRLDLVPLLEDLRDRFPHDFPR